MELNDEEEFRRRRMEEALDKMLLELPEQLQSVRDELTELEEDVKERIGQCHDKMDSLFKTVYSVMDSVRALKEASRVGGGGGGDGGESNNTTSDISTTSTTTTAIPVSPPQALPPAPSTSLQASSGLKRSLPDPPLPPEGSSSGLLVEPPSKIERVDHGGGGGGEVDMQVQKVKVVAIASGVNPFDGITDPDQVSEADLLYDWDLIRASTKIPKRFMNLLRKRRKKLRRREINEERLKEGKPRIDFNIKELQ